MRPPQIKTTPNSTRSSLQYKWNSICVEVRFNMAYPKHMMPQVITVDRILNRVPIKKTTQGRPNECQIVYLGITIK